MHNAQYEFGISSSGRGWLLLESIPTLLGAGPLIVAAAWGGSLSLSLSFRALFALAAVVFGYLGYLSLKTLLNQEPMLRLSKDGIEERGFGFGLIPWTAILDGQVVFETQRGLNRETLYLRVADWRPYLNRISMFYRPVLPLLAFRRKLIPLELTYLDVAMDDLIEIVQLFQPAFRVN
jgi:hypothetical protein